MPAPAVVSTTAAIINDENHVAPEPAVIEAISDGNQNCTDENGSEIVNNQQGDDTAVTVQLIRTTVAQLRAVYAELRLQLSSNNVDASNVIVPKEMFEKLESEVSGKKNCFIVYIQSHLNSPLIVQF